MPREAETTRNVHVAGTGDLATAAAGRHVLLIDDILDTGHTLTRIHEQIGAIGPESLKTCVLLDKPARREVPFETDFCGFTIEDRFVVGYGLDIDGELRNLPYVAVLKQD